MVGSIISGALQLGSSIYGAIAGAQAMSKYRGELAKRERENQAWYDRRYNERATERADAQYMLTKLNDSIKARNRAAAGTAAVMGQANEAVAAEKAAGNEAMAEAAARIAAQGEQRKDAIEDKYMAAKNQIRDAKANLEVQRAGNVAKAVQGVAGAAGSIAGLATQNYPAPAGKAAGTVDAGTVDSTPNTVDTSGAVDNAGDTGTVNDPYNQQGGYYNQYYA